VRGTYDLETICRGVLELGLSFSSSRRGVNLASSMSVSADLGAKGLGDLGRCKPSDRWSGLGEECGVAVYGGNPARASEAERTSIGWG
jgi:hypothetical protein